MLQSILNTVLGCGHRRTTFPLTPVRGGARTYIVCLDCGREFAYDWANMRVGQPVAPRKPVALTQPQTPTMAA
jgi:hypothetical protein